QAEDGIRDFHVTGVQTCALPISPMPALSAASVPSAPSPTPRTAPRTQSSAASSGGPPPVTRLALPASTPTLRWLPTCCSASPERSEAHTSELQSRENLVCRLLLE